MFGAPQNKESIVFGSLSATAVPPLAQNTEHLYGRSTSSLRRIFQNIELCVGRDCPSDFDFVLNWDRSRAISRISRPHLIPRITSERTILSSKISSARDPNTSNFFVSPVFQFNSDNVPEQKDESVHLRRAVVNTRTKTLIQ